VLASLVDKSLLQMSDAGGRLRMLETIREYGAEKLAERAVRGAPELSEVRRRHALYYADLMIEAAPRLLTRDQLTWLKVVQADRDNILGALHYWCREHDAARAIALSVSLAGLAFLLGDHTDLTDLIGPAVAVPGDADPDLRTIAESLHVITLSVHPGQGDLAEDAGGYPGLTERMEALDFEKFPLAGLLRPAYAMFTQDLERARRYVDEALGSKDEWLAAASWLAAAALAENGGDMDTLRSAAAQGLSRFRVLGERWGLMSALRIVGSVRVRDGDLDGAAAMYAEAGRVQAELGSRDDESHVQLQLADIAARRGDVAAAREFYQAALVAAESDGTGMDAAVVSAGLAMFEVTVGNVEQARVMHAVAQEGLARLRLVHPARHHLLAVAEASGLMIALADGDLGLARERAASVYREGVASEDMPLLAAVGGALAHLARALGQPGRAAGILGACAVVRGGEDLTDLAVAMLAPQLKDALGPDGYGQAYAAGTALSRADAVALLDPATLG
jgi:tetratricopeptide (TPR) repeat protein